MSSLGEFGVLGAIVGIALDGGPKLFDEPLKRRGGRVRWK